MKLNKLIQFIICLLPVLRKQVINKLINAEIPKTITYKSTV
jgi:hypothetical protein